MQITGISPTSGKQGSKLTIIGKGFTALQGHANGKNKVTIGGAEAEVAHWSDKKLDVIVPAIGTGAKEVAVVLMETNEPQTDPSKPPFMFSVIPGVQEPEKPKTPPTPTPNPPVPPKAD